MPEAKILVSDDDNDIRRGLNARLRDCGYQTCFAGDGVSAIRHGARNQPALR